MYASRLEQSRTAPVNGSEDLSNKLGISPPNPFRLPQHRSPFVAHFYPVLNPSKSIPFIPSDSLLSPSSESVFGVGRADILCNELYKNLLRSASKLHVKRTIKGEQFPFCQQTESSHNLNGGLTNCSDQVTYRSQFKAFYEDLRGRFAPSDHLRRLYSESDLVAHNLREDSAEKNCNTWGSSSTACFPRLPYVPFPQSAASASRYNSLIAPANFRNSSVTSMTAPALSLGHSSSSLRPMSDSGRESSSNSPERSQPVNFGRDITVWDQSKDGCASVVECATPSSSRSDDQISIPSDRLKRKRRLASSTETCPVCGVTVRESEMKQHFLQESSRLDKIPMEVCRNSKRSNAIRKSSIGVGSAEFTIQPTTSSKKHGENDNEKYSSCKLNRQKTFQKVRSNRIDRFNSRVGQCRQALWSGVEISSKFRAPWMDHGISPTGKSEEAVCPVCSMPFADFSSHEEISDHVIICSGGKGHERGDSIGVEEDAVEESDSGAFEEYEWCGETRIRATALARRELISDDSNFHIIKNADGDEADQDLDVESDGTRDYGSVQFTDSDLLAPMSSDDESPIPPEPAHHSKTSVTESFSSASPLFEGDAISSCRYPSALIHALKMKIQDLEGCDRNSRCLICMNPYRRPLVSIQCWHVHCKSCWLRALGVKKLCPQCNMITPASQLRRIFL